MSINLCQRRKEKGSL